MNSPSEINDLERPVQPSTVKRVGLSGNVIAALVLLIAVIEKSIAAMQSPSAGRMIMAGAYAVGLAAACFTLWHIMAKSRGKALNPRVAQETRNKKRTNTSRSCSSRAWLASLGNMYSQPRYPTHSSRQGWRGGTRNLIVDGWGSGRVGRPLVSRRAWAQSRFRVFCVFRGWLWFGFGRRVLTEKGQPRNTRNTRNRLDQTCELPISFEAFVSFVSFVVSCAPASVDGYSRRGINHEIHETHENVRIGLVWVLVPWHFSSRPENLHARGESGTLRVTAGGEG